MVPFEAGQETGVPVGVADEVVVEVTEVDVEVVTDEMLEVVVLDKIDEEVALPLSTLDVVATTLEVVDLT